VLEEVVPMRANRPALGRVAWIALAVLVAVLAAVLLVMFGGGGAGGGGGGGGGY
jgi:hypothetical protein